MVCRGFLKNLSLDWKTKQPEVTLRLEARAEDIERLQDKILSVELKQYREKDGLFYFKLVNGQGKTLLTAGGLPSGKEVGAHLQSFKASGLGALKDIFCQLDAEATEAEVQSALDELTQE